MGGYLFHLPPWIPDSTKKVNKGSVCDRSTVAGWDKEDRDPNLHLFSAEGV